MIDAKERRELNREMNGEPHSELKSESHGGLNGEPHSELNCAIKRELEKRLEEARCGESPAPILVAIDGRCAAGKTTLAARLQAEWRCPVFHMDDFFLRPQQRTPERLAQAGENVDHERFKAEILEPWIAGRPFSYRPYSCAEQKLSPAIEVRPGPLALVEGSYSCHRELRAYYALRIFLNIDPALQEQRLRQRNGAAGWERFRDLWIPLEERYFATGVRDCCELVLDA